MADHSNRSDLRLQKVAREGDITRAHHEVEAKALREKTARLRELRLAREAAAGKPAAVAKRRKSVAKSETLSEWLTAQKSQGRRG